MLPILVLPAMLVMLGAAGAVVSMTTVTAVLNEPWFKAPSVAFAVMVCVPAVRTGVNNHAPDALAVVVPMADALL